MTRWPNILRALRTCDGWDQGPQNDEDDEAWLLANSTEEERIAAEAAVTGLDNMPGAKGDLLDTPLFKFCNPEDGEAEALESMDPRLHSLALILERIF